MGGTSPAAAREATHAIDIPAGSLESALARFSEQTGVSIGVAGALPRLVTRRVAGRMSADAALRRLLKGSGLRARRAGATYRIERAPRSAPPPPAPIAEPPLSPLTAPDIIVTSKKRPELLATVPMSISVIPLAPFGEGPATPSSRDITLGAEGLAETNLGPGRNRQFIRGVADSPFIGKSQSTVAVQIDDTRATFDAPNPDMHLIDVERVEILKGPQGPLYGSGALGGIYHIVTRRPDLDHASATLRLSGEGVQHGGVAGSVEAVANMPLADGRLAVRAVGYRIVRAGWIDNEDGRTDSNSTRVAGIRLGLRWRPADDWTVDLGVAQQDIDARDTQYVLSGNDALIRPNRIAEPTDNDFGMAHATIEGRLGGLRLVSATSIVGQGFDTVLDASAASASFGLKGAARFSDRRTYSLFNQELRLSPFDGGRWLVGLSVLGARSKGDATITDEAGASRIVDTINRRTVEYAVFGEASWPLLGRLDATLGARIFRTVSRDMAAEPEGERIRLRTKTLVSPSASLSLPLANDGIVYLRYARAKRPGGLAVSDGEGVGTYDADRINTIDLGVRKATADGRLALSGSGYFTWWDRVQSDYLLPNGLISTRNAGSARIIGIEAALDWRLGGGLSVSAGGAVQHSRLLRGADGEALDNRRLPVAPALTGRVEVAQAIGIAGWRGEAAVQANYIGSARLSFDSDLDRQMGNYAVVAARLTVSRGPWTVGATLDNALDLAGDSFAFGNPFSIREGPQYTPLRPRTLMLSIARRW
ncbi:TonB-dependent receptor domain-containing protein [Sphingomonas sanxanigenens]|uniref:TonB-dependent receptor domain-containing protein n=1 Tax=Sphingomonas sanxanigenens TaxID=397260 RepID=UPI003CCBC9DD